MKTLSLSALVLIGTLVTTRTVSAQHSNHQDHGSMHATMLMPTEPGDSSFAAIAEIVQLLSQNPDTD